MGKSIVCLTLMLSAFLIPCQLKAQADSYPPELIRPRRPAMPGDFEGNPKSQVRRQQLDMAQAKRNARALVELANRISAEVDLLAQNKLAQDLPRQLKQVQKIAKRLSSEITPREELSVPAISRVDDHP